DQVGRLGGVKQVPVLVVLHALHELIRDPHGGVGGTRAAVWVTRVLAQVQELGEVHVPVLHVEGQRTKLLATPRHCTQRRVNGVHKGDGASRRGVVRLNGRTFATQLGD